ncbi:MAG: NUDIX hydrolase [Chloroflexia bacterium]
MSRIETKNEYSAGGVVFRVLPGGKGWEIAIVKRTRYINESWSLPKGHIEKGETREQAAIREVKEESGVDASPLFSLGEIEYYFRKEGDRIRKIVYYYMMETINGELGGPNSEVAEARWVNINEVRSLLSYDRDKDVVTKALVELRVRFPENDDR